MVVGYIYFWFAGALVRSNMLTLCGSVLEVSESVNSLLLGAVAIGIGLGALAAGFLSYKKIERGLIPIGSGGMFVFGVLLGVPKNSVIL